MCLLEKESSTREMMYSVRGGWRNTNTVCDKTLQACPTSLSNHNWKKNDDDEEDAIDGGSEEIDDFAAPLPGERLSAGKQLGKPGMAKGTPAKDKRRLREKRRSTGVASLGGHEADEVTSRNTSYNETPGVDDNKEEANIWNQSTIHSTPVNNDSSVVCSTSANDGVGEEEEEEEELFSHADQSQPRCVLKSFKKNHVIEDCSTISEEISAERLKSTDASENSSTSKSTPGSTKGFEANLPSRSSAGPPPSPSLSSDLAKNYCARPSEAKKGILKVPSRPPVIAPKPDLSTAHFSAHSQRTSGQRSNDENRLTSRVSELEALLDSEKREKSVLEKLLAVRDTRIRQLESQITCLNEDLCLADDDYLRLEEENRALTRALSQLGIEQAK